MGWHVSTKTKCYYFSSAGAMSLTLTSFKLDKKRARLRQPPTNLFFRKLPVNLYAKIRPVQGQVVVEVISTCHTFCYNSQ